MENNEVIQLRDTLKAGQNIPLRIFLDNAFSIIDESLVTQFTLWDDKNGYLYSFRTIDPQSDRYPNNSEKAISLFVTDYTNIQAMEAVRVPLTSLDTIFDSIVKSGRPIKEEMRKLIKNTYDKILSNDLVDPMHAYYNSLLGSHLDTENDYYNSKYAERYQETLPKRTYNNFVNKVNDLKPYEDNINGVVKFPELTINHGIIHIVKNNTEFTKTLANVKNGNVIELKPNTTITDDLTLDKNISIIGDGTSIISGKITVKSDDGIVEFNNVKFANATGEDPKAELITIAGNSDTVISYCTFSNLKSYRNIIRVTNAKPGNIIVNAVTFKKNDNVYHCLELGPGITLSKVFVDNCKFERGCCSGNCINMYKFADNADVYLSNNTFEYSGNAYRFSNVTSANVNVRIADNHYDETDSTPITEEDGYTTRSKYYSGLIVFENYNGNDDYSKMKFDIKNLTYGKANKVILGNNYDGKYEDQIYYVLLDKPEYKSTYPEITFSK